MQSCHSGGTLLVRRCYTKDISEHHRGIEQATKRSSGFVISLGYRLAWIDTCCMNKSSSADLNEAINSMYEWYQKPGRCYAYLHDKTILDWEHLQSQDKKDPSLSPCYLSFRTNNDNADSWGALGHFCPVTSTTLWNKLSLGTEMYPVRRRQLSLQYSS